jgi:general secretion pathway protein I
MLLEALVALALVLAFAGVLGPVLFHARRIMTQADSRIAAQALLRSLIDAPFDRAKLGNSVREGDSAELHWRISATPLALDMLSPAPAPSSAGSGRKGAANEPGKGAPDSQPPNWSAYRVVATVTWARDQSITAETVRLGRVRQ